MNAKKFRDVLSYLVAILRKDRLIRPKNLSIIFLFLYNSLSKVLGSFRLDFEGMTASAPCSQTSALIQSAS